MKPVVIASPVVAAYVALAVLLHASIGAAFAYAVWVWALTPVECLVSL